jgi:hypothetical protein
MVSGQSVASTNRLDALYVAIRGEDKRLGCDIRAFSIIGPLIAS